MILTQWNTLNILLSNENLSSNFKDIKYLG